MRKHVLVAVMVVGVAALVGSSAVYAQGPLSKVTVPFEFVVGDTILPAGSYDVTPFPGQSDIVLFRSPDGKSSAAAVVQTTGIWKANANALFSFRKIGGQYFLSQMSIPGSDARALSLPKDRVDAVLARVNGKTRQPGLK